MIYSLREIADIVGGQLLGNETLTVSHLLSDSRTLRFTNSVLFVALKGESGDGHKYINDLIVRGIQSFLVSSWPFDEPIPDNIGVVVVDDTLMALQKLVSIHSQRFSCPVIGITGSNGKTVVKEWINSCLNADFVITRSPKSYNSQIGVPLSVWDLSVHTELAIFEAGISQPGEMSRLELIINPTIGVFTNLGDAHQENFIDKSQKLQEKAILFRNSKTIIMASDDLPTLEAMRAIYQKKQFYTWGKNLTDNVSIETEMFSSSHTKISVTVEGKHATMNIPFRDSASIQNAGHTIAVMCFLGIDLKIIAQRVALLQSIDMRMDMKKGRNGCTIINDSYNSDLISLQSSLEFLAYQNQAQHKIVVVSDIVQSGLAMSALYERVAKIVDYHGFDQLIGVGPQIKAYQHLFTTNSLFFETTQDLLNHFEALPPQNSIVLLKGSRVFRFERVDRLLQDRQHRTVMDVNLDVMVSNLRVFRSILKPETKIIAMLKAFGYGTGSFELANLLQHHNVDYLAVAFTDEAIHLRENNIQLPIMVMNPGIETIAEIVQYRLEPEVFSSDFLTAFEFYLANNSITDFPVHIKVDSGMNRSGFKKEDIAKLIVELKKCTHIKVSSVFSHLVAADDPQFDDFTRQQIQEYENMCQAIGKVLGYSFFRHILNSAGAERFPQSQFEAIRLGIGLYGITFDNNKAIKQVATLRSRVMQIKEITQDQTVGYGRKGKLARKSIIATIPIGYADGFRRSLGNGKGKMLINGQLAPTIGNVCMDMTMLDVTGMDVAPGDDVIIFGPDLPLAHIAHDMETIPYEVLTGISSRVRRIYYRE